MSEIREVWIHTTEDIYCFDEDDVAAGKFESFLRENPKDVTALYISETMTVEEFNRCHPHLAVKP